MCAGFGEVVAIDISTVGGIGPFSAVKVECPGWPITRGCVRTTSPKPIS